MAGITTNINIADIDANVVISDVSTAINIKDLVTSVNNNELISNIVTSNYESSVSIGTLVVPTSNIPDLTATSITEPLNSTVVIQDLATAVGINTLSAQVTIKDLIAGNITDARAYDILIQNLEANSIISALNTLFDADLSSNDFPPFYKFARGLEDLLVKETLFVKRITKRFTEPKVIKELVKLLYKKPLQEQAKKFTESVAKRVIKVRSERTRIRDRFAGDQSSLDGQLRITIRFNRVFDEDVSPYDQIPSKRFTKVASRDRVFAQTTSVLTNVLNNYRDKITTSDNKKVFASILKQDYLRLSQPDNKSIKFTKIVDDNNRSIIDDSKFYLKSKILKNDRFTIDDLDFTRIVNYIRNVQDYVDATDDIGGITNIDDDQNALFIKVLKDNYLAGEIFNTSITYIRNNVDNITVYDLDGLKFNSKLLKTESIITSSYLSNITVNIIKTSPEINIKDEFSRSTNTIRDFNETVYSTITEFYYNYLKSIDLENVLAKDLNVSKKSETFLYDANIQTSEFFKSLKFFNKLLYEQTQTSNQDIFVNLAAVLNSQQVTTSEFVDLLKFYLKTLPDEVSFIVADRPAFNIGLFNSDLIDFSIYSNLISEQIKFDVAVTIFEYEHYVYTSDVDGLIFDVNTILNPDQAILFNDRPDLSFIKPFEDFINTNHVRPVFLIKPFKTDQTIINSNFKYFNVESIRADTANLSDPKLLKVNYIREFLDRVVNSDNIRNLKPKIFKNDRVTLQDQRALRVNYIRQFLDKITAKDTDRSLNVKLSLVNRRFVFSFDVEIYLKTNYIRQFSDKFSTNTNNIIFKKTINSALFDSLNRSSDKIIFNIKPVITNHNVSTDSNNLNFAFTRRRQLIDFLGINSSTFNNIIKFKFTKQASNERISINSNNFNYNVIRRFTFTDRFISSIQKPLLKPIKLLKDTSPTNNLRPQFLIRQVIRDKGITGKILQLKSTKIIADVSVKSNSDNFNYTFIRRRNFADRFISSDQIPVFRVLKVLKDTTTTNNPRPQFLIRKLITDKSITSKILRFRSTKSTTDSVKIGEIFFVKRIFNVQDIATTKNNYIIFTVKKLLTDRVISKNIRPQFLITLRKNDRSNTGEIRQLRPKITITSEKITSNSDNLTYKRTTPVSISDRTISSEKANFRSNTLRTFLDRITTREIFLYVKFIDTRPADRVRSSGSGTTNRQNYFSNNYVQPGYAGTNTTFTG
jgi:hypothetical protein